jgi:uncharacterized protein YdgA (DUF945 family)
MTMLWETIALQASIAERGKLVDIAYDVNVKAIRMLGEQVDDMRIVSRGTSIDAKAFEVLSLAMAANPRSPDDKDLFGGNKKEIIAFAKNVGANGSALELDEISALFRGHKVMISGRVSLAPLKDADFKTAAAFSSKVTARLEVTAPVGLVTEIAAIMARQQAKAKEQVVSEEAVAQMAQMMTDGMVGKVTSSGFATLKDGMLSAIVEFKGGKLMINNKVIELPKAKPAAKPASKKKK